MTNKLNAIKFIKILDIAISADICFEGDAEDAKEILDLFNALRARAERAERMVERLIEAGDEYGVCLHNPDINRFHRLIDARVWNAIVAEWQARDE